MARNNKNDPLISVSLKIPMSKKLLLDQIAKTQERSVNYVTCKVIEAYIDDTLKGIMK